LDRTVGYYGALITSLVVCVATFVTNQKYRKSIDRCLATVQSPVPLKVPERLKRYDADYLNSFKQAASQLSTPYGKRALELYVRPTLLWIDVGFAISLAAFVALIWLGILNSFPQASIVLGVAKFCLAMAVGYGMADVAEDVWLAKLLSQQGCFRGYSVKRETGQVTPEDTEAACCHWPH
jgi:hypothetical protein